MGDDETLAIGEATARYQEATQKAREAKEFIAKAKSEFREFRDAPGPCVVDGQVRASKWKHAETLTWPSVEEVIEVLKALEAWQRRADDAAQDLLKRGIDVSSWPKKDH